MNTSMGSISLRTTAFVLIMVLSLVWSAVAQAQSPDDRSADVQYKKPSSPSGPVAGTTPAPTPEGGLLIEEELCVAPGASVTVEDADRTQGTFIAGDGASVNRIEGGILVSGSPQNVAGGDQKLDTETASIVTSTGISQCAEEASVGDVLPDTAGVPLILLALGGILIATGTATALLRRPGQR